MSRRPIQNDGELALLYALIWLYFAASGAGPASVDGRREDRGTHDVTAPR